MFLSLSIRYYEMTLVTLKTLFLDLEFFRAGAMSYSSLCFHAVCLKHQRFSHISSLPRWSHSHLPDVIYFVRLGFFGFVHSGSGTYRFCFVVIFFIKEQFRKNPLPFNTQSFPERLKFCLVDCDWAI